MEAARVMIGYGRGALFYVHTYPPAPFASVPLGRPPRAAVAACSYAEAGRMQEPSCT